MKSKTSFFNKGLISSWLRRYCWVSILWSILLFLAVPFSIINTKPDAIDAAIASDNYFMFIGSFGVIFSHAMLCIFPVITGAMVFSYLHSPKSATTLHGMPLSRARLFVNSLIAGLINMIIPFLVSGISIAVIIATMPIGKLITYTTLLLWLLDSLCTALIIYALTVFVGMFTGNLIAHMVFTYIIHFLPLAVFLSAIEILHIFLHGYAYPDVPSFLTNMPMMSFRRHFSAECCATYVLSSAALLIAAFLVYRKRPVESAGSIVSFRFLRPIFKYGATFCTMITGYSFYAAASGKTHVSDIFGAILLMVLFAAVGYCAAQMLLSKTWRIWRAWKGLAVSIIITCALVGVLKFDVFGYEKYVPSSDITESITLSGLSGTAGKKIVLDDKADIEKVISIHKLLADSKNDSDEILPVSGITISYSTKRGSVRRSYSFSDENVSLKNAFIDLYLSKDLKTQGFAILGGESPDRLKVITIRNMNGFEKVISDKKQISALVNAYNTDIMNMSAEDLYNMDYAEDFCILETEAEEPVLLTAPIELTYAAADVRRIYQAYYVKNNFSLTRAYIENNIYNQE